MVQFFIKYLVLFLYLSQQVGSPRMCYIVSSLIRLNKVFFSIISIEYIPKYIEQM